MSTLTAHSPLKVFDNAAFDVEAPGAAAGENLPWLPLQPISLDPAKENRSPNSANKPLAADIDSEIEEVEREIGRLSKKLHLLKVKKKAAETAAGPSPKRSAAATTPFAKRGRVVPAKFMNAEPAPPLQQRRVQQSPGGGCRRGMSLGPMEISRIPFPASVRTQEPPAEIPGAAYANRAAEKKKTKVQESLGGDRRGLSLGPMEISGLATPLRSGTGRKPMPRKLGGIKEEKDSATSLRRRGMSIGPAEIFSARSKGAKETRARRSLSTSPKPRRAAATSSRVSELRKGVSTVGAKKPVRREQGPGSNIKPKALFQESKTPAAATTTGNRPNAKVRVVASRYSLIGCGSEPDSKKRKWSLPEPGKGDRSGLVEAAGGGGGSGSSRSLSLGGSIAVNSTTEEERASSPPSIMKMAAALPKIRMLRRGATESPRDSGCAKRVAELVGRRSCFAADDGTGSSSCQSLNFDEEDQ